MYPSIYLVIYEHDLDRNRKSKIVQVLCITYVEHELSIPDNIWLFDEPNAFS